MAISVGTVTQAALTGGAGVHLTNAVVDSGHTSAFVGPCLPTGGFPNDFTAMSWNSVSFAPRVKSQDNSNNTSADSWFGNGLTAGTNDLITNSNHGFSDYLVFVSLGGVATSSALGTPLSTSGSGNVSNTVTTVAGDIVISIIVADPNTTTFAAANGQTVLVANHTNGATVMSVGYQIAVGTSTVDGYTVTGASHNTALISVPIHAAAGGVAGQPTMRRLSLTEIGRTGVSFNPASGNRSGTIMRAEHPDVIAYRRDEARKRHAFMQRIQRAA